MYYYVCNNHRRRTFATSSTCSAPSSKTFFTDALPFVLAGRLGCPFRVYIHLLDINGLLLEILSR